MVFGNLKNQSKKIVLLFFLALSFFMNVNTVHAQERNEAIGEAKSRMKVQFFAGEDVIMIDAYGIIAQDVVVKIFNDDEKEVYSKKMFLRKGASIITPLDGVAESSKYLVKLITKEGELTSEFSKKR